jgi:hypothetical protein
MCRIENRGYIYQFLPKEFEYLTKTKKVDYKEYKLKSDFLINIMHELILKFYFSENQEVKYNLWSSILRRKYGKTYNIYIQYLVDNKFFDFVSNYYVGKKAKTYKLNITSLDIIRYKATDNILLKKHKKDYLIRTFTAQQESTIPIDLRKKLIDDLYHVEIDYDKAFKWLNMAKKRKEIDLHKYMKNLSSIDGIDTGHVFFKFDAFGRLHTNFTVLKKFIRQNCLTIDGELLSEIDIVNSQPFFFAVYLKNEIGIENFNDEVRKYVDCVKNGLIYDEFHEKFPDKLKSRNEAKMMMYKILFGNNFDNKKESKIFKSLYPTVYEYIKEFKYLSDSYKSLSHELQNLESNFIFNTVIQEIKTKFPHIRLFTVHDSIVFPSKYKNEIELIFNSLLRKLL